MISLNLLPPEEKEGLFLGQIQRWIIFYGSAFLFSLSIFIALLLVMRLSIFIQQKSLNESLGAANQSAQGQDLKSQQKLIEELNSQLEMINNFEKNLKRYSAILITLAEIMPPGIQLNSLIIDEQNKIILAGYAQKRGDVIDLEERLGSAGAFVDIKSPLANLTKQSDLNFSLSAVIKAEYLRK